MFPDLLSVAFGIQQQQAVISVTFSSFRYISVAFGIYHDPFCEYWSEVSSNFLTLVLPLIRSAVRYIPAWPTPSNHTPIPAVAGGNTWPAITEEEPKNKTRDNNC